MLILAAVKKELMLEIITDVKSLLLNPNFALVSVLSPSYMHTRTHAHENYIVCIF